MCTTQFFKQLDSTQLEAKRQLLAEQVNEVTAIVADEQTNGYGRYKRPFFSPNAGLYMSIIVPKYLISCRTTLITHATAVALISVLTQSGYRDIGIKWINDLYHLEKKIAGVLVDEIDVIGKTYFIIGIGLNVNKQDVPLALIEKMGMLNNNDYVDPKSLIKPVISTVLTVLSLGKFDILNRYRQSCMMFGRTIQAQVGHEVIEGQAIGIDEFGGLIVKTNSGQRVLHTGEVTQISF